MSTPSTLRTIAKNLRGLPDEDLQAWIDLAKLFVSDSIWGTKYGIGVAYLAAHLATISERGGRGMVTSESLGSASWSYSSPSGTKELGTTAYGAMFISIQRTVSPGPMVIRGCGGIEDG